MLIGGSNNKVDKKGRIFVPSKFKEELGEKVVLCYHIFGKRCLWCFSEAEFDKFSARLGQEVYFEVSEMVRLLSDGAQPVDVDASGRILIPADLRELAGIGEEVRIVGMGNNFEIWDINVWKEEKSTLQTRDFSSVAKNINFSFGN